MHDFLTAQLRILFAGLLALLPLALTLAAAAWLGSLLFAYTGPQSTFGSLLAAIGLTVVTNPAVAYGVGFLAVVVCLYIVGLFVHSQLRTEFAGIGGRLLGRIPLLGSVYNLMSRFVGVLGKQDAADTAAMAPVWCFFGGEGGAAALGLLSSPEPVLLQGRRYVAVLVPTAPVPFGGGLLFVPAEWVVPAAIGAEALTSIYVSMGMTTPQFLAKAPPDTAA
jgi:uncharacterized membrane protein